MVHCLGVVGAFLLAGLHAFLASHPLVPCRTSKTGLHPGRFPTALWLQDAVQRGDTDACNVGRAIVLPSSFLGGPRHMHQLYQDAMAIVRKLGKPDLFITITCNPKWREIQEQLLPGQAALDRPDLVDRVFKLKVDANEPAICHPAQPYLCSAIACLQCVSLALRRAQV